MKKVKTYLLAVLFIIASSIMGACSCGGPDIAVAGIKVSAVSSNLLYNESTNEYSILQGETFTVSYELLPDNATVNTVYVDVTPANKLSYSDSIIKAAKSDLEFTAPKENKGKVTISLTTKDGSKKVELNINIVSVNDLTLLTTPTGVRYDATAKKIKWDAAKTATGELENVHGYNISVVYGEVVEHMDITEKVDDKYPTELSYDFTPGQEYFVRINSIGDVLEGTYNSLVSESIRFMVLEAPKNFKNANGILSWDYENTQNITGYRVTFDGKVKEINNPNTKSIDLSPIIEENGYNLSTFTATVAAINSNYGSGKENEADHIFTYILDSNQNPTISLTTLTAPANLRYENDAEVNSPITNTFLKWDDVKGAKCYNVVVYKGGTTTVQFADALYKDTKLNLSGYPAGKYDIKITVVGDQEKVVRTSNNATASSSFVVMPVLKATAITKSTNSLVLDLSGLNTLIGAENLSKLKFEVFTKSATGSYNRYGSKTIVDPASSIDLTQIKVDGGYNVLVRPVNDTCDTLNLVVSNFTDADKSYAYLINQLALVESVGVKNQTNGDVVLEISDPNSENIAATEYLVVLKVGEIETQKTIAVTSEHIIKENEKTLINLSSLFVGQLSQAGDYAVKVVAKSDTNIDGSVSLTPYFEFSKLESVDGFQVGKNNTITWAASEKAASYVVKINDQNYVEVNDFNLVDGVRYFYYVVSDDVLAAVNIVSFVALGNNLNVISSNTATFEKITRAGAVENIRIENGILTWDNVAGSTYYVTISTADSEPITDTITVNTFDGLGKIRIADGATLTITRGLNGMFNSAASEPITLNRLNQPDATTFAVVNNTNKIKFRAVENANSYLLTIKKDGVNKNITISAPSIVNGFVEYSLESLASGTYTVRIQAQPADQLSGTNFNLISDFSDVATFVVYPKIEVTSTTGTLKYTFNETQFLKHFLISFSNGEHDNIITDELNYAFLDLLSGTYDITIAAVAENGSNAIVNVPTAVTITKIGTTTLQIVDNLVVFSPVENADSYVITINGEIVENCTFETNGSGLIVIKNLVVEEGSVQEIAVRALGSANYLNGNFSKTISVKIADAPTNAKITDNTLSWSGSASVYVVEFNETKTEVTTNSFGLPEMATEGDYVVKIYAKGGNEVGGVYYLNSNTLSVTITRLSTINNMQIVGGKLTFSYDSDVKPAHIELYLEYLDGENWTPVKIADYPYSSDVNYSYDLSQITEYDAFKLKAVALGDQNAFTLNGTQKYFVGTVNGVENVEIITRVDIPTFSYKLGVLSVSLNDTYSGYDFYEVNGETKKLVNLSVNESGEITITKTGENITLVAVAKAGRSSGKIDSLMSEQIVVNKLNAVTDFKIENGVFKWSKVDSATSYQIINLTDLSKTKEVMGGDSVSYDYSAELDTLEKEVEYKFAIIAMGSATAGAPVVNYLNSDVSNNSYITCVGNVASLTISNGVVYWASNPAVKGYLVEIFDMQNAENPTRIFSKIVVVNQLDMSKMDSLVGGGNYSVAVTPVSTNDFNHIATGNTAATLGFSRYNIFKSVGVQNGLITITLSTNNADMETIKNLYKVYITKGESALLATGTEDELALNKQYTNFYGYLNINLSVLGYAPSVITPADMLNTVFTSTEIVCYYQLPISVAVTTKLDLNFSNKGNIGETGSDTIVYLPSFSKTLSAYKYSAPVTTGKDNLTVRDGDIYFTRILKANGGTNEYETKYLLTAQENTKDNTRVTTFFAVIDTSVIGDEATFIFNPYKKQYFNYSTGSYVEMPQMQYKFYGSFDTIYTVGPEWDADGLNANTDFKFSLCALGSENAEDETLALRSNVYNTVDMLYLKDTSGFAYSYVNTDINGGFLSWTANESAVGYKLYVLSRKIIEEKYPSEIDSLKANRQWVSYMDNNIINVNDKGIQARIIELDPTATSFLFDDEIVSGLQSGDYWCALRTLGNGDNIITADEVSAMVEIYKLNSVTSATLNNGVFNWQPNATDASRVSGYKLMVYTYQEGQKVEVGLGEIYDSNSYELLERAVISGIEYDFSGVDGSRFGLGVVAIGGKVGSVQCVSSAVTSITARDANGAEVGYKRLPQVNCSVNLGLSKIEWDYPETEETDLKQSTKSYTVFVSNGGNSIEAGDYDGYAFANFTKGGTYDILIRANASGSTYLSSAKSQPFKIVKYYEPTLNVKNGVVSWSGDAALVPITSTIKIEPCSADGTVTGNPIEYNQALSGSINLYEFDSSVGSGYYLITIKHNPNTVTETIDGSTAVEVYHLESNENTIIVYRYAMPQVDNVPILSEQSGEGSEIKNTETGFGSAIKWNVVKDANNNIAQNYKIGLAVQSGDVVGQIFTLNLNLSDTTLYYLRDGSFESYPDNMDTNYMIEYNSVTGVIYLNIDIKKLATILKEDDLKGKKVVVTIMVSGNTTNGSDGLINSAIVTKTIDFSSIAPDAKASDTTHGIIRWTGSDNPVRITYTVTVNGERKTYSKWIGSDYMDLYGKEYYLPYASSATYSAVTVQYLLSNTVFSDPTEIQIGTISLFSDGDGSEKNPYVITTATQFANIQYRPLSYFVVPQVQSGDNLVPAEFTMSGNWAVINNFAGVINGNGAIINNINLTHTLSNDTVSTAMFTNIMEGAVINDLTLNFKTEIRSGTQAYNAKLTIAGLALNNYGTINNIKIGGSIDLYSSLEMTVSGVVINNYGTINGVEIMSGFKASTSSNVGSGDYMIDLIGVGVAFNNYSVISNSSFNGQLNMRADSSLSSRLVRSAAGIAFNNYSVILNCDFTGSLTAFNMAGIAAYNNYLLDSTNQPIVLEQSNHYEGGHVIGCYASGKFTLAGGNIASSIGIKIAGIVGENSAATVYRCYVKQSFNFSLPSGFHYVGGIVAVSRQKTYLSNDVYAKISNCYAEVSGNVNQSSGNAKYSAICAHFITTTEANYNISSSYYYVISGNINVAVSGKTDAQLNNAGNSVTKLSSTLTNDSKTLVDGEQVSIIEVLNGGKFQDGRKFNYYNETLILQ